MSHEISSGSRWRTRPLPTWTLAAVLLAALLAIYLIVAPNAGSLPAFNGTIRTSLPLILLALGQTVVMLTGGIDLSIGALASLCVAVAVTVINAKSSPGDVVIGALIVLAVGGVGGLLNAIAIARFRLQPIIATFGTSFVFGGLALVVLPAPGGAIPFDLVLAFNSDPLVISNTILVAVSALVVWGLLMRTRYRDFLYATGASTPAAYASGVPVQRIRASAYIVAGLFAAFAAMALVLTTGTGDPNSGLSLVLPAVVAAIVGGTSLSGGRGGLIGTALAALSLGLLQVLLSLSAIPPSWQLLAYGVAIVFALALGTVPRLIANARLRKEPAHVG